MKQKVLNVVSVLYGLLFINSGLNKIFQYMPMPTDMPEVMIKMMGSFVEIGWILPVVAVVEIIAGILVWFTKFRALGAIMLFPIMIGILMTHIYGGGLPFALVFMGILGWIMFENRTKYLPMVN
jgi:putative oxidoreductase